MRWCERCKRRYYDDTARFCPFDGLELDAPDAPPVTRSLRVPTKAEAGVSRAEGSDAHLGRILLGQFRIEGVIGQGAMGTVYRAWQSGMERPVAVKLLRPELVGDKQVRARFVREARAAARLSHPNIVGVHLVGETDDGSPYLIMEHLDGESLEDTIMREDRLSNEHTADIARQIAWGLAQAHAEGIVHRDLKPANIMRVGRRGPGELVKILDFGIAKITPHPLLAAKATVLTKQGTVFGTPNYISPEQAQSSSIDGRSDIYSLGVLMYRLLSGKLPFEGNAMAVMLAHIARDPQPLVEAAPWVDERLADFAMRCMAKDAADRPGSADEVGEFLEDWLGRVRPPAVMPRGSRPRPVRYAEAITAVGRSAWR